MKTYLDIRNKRGKRDYCDNEYNAEVTKGQIRIWGIVKNHAPDEPHIEFDRVFKVGDQAEYDSYNLSYTGIIVSIGKTVTIARQGRFQTGKRRLSLFQFCWRNWNFDLEKTRQQNLKEMQCL